MDFTNYLTMRSSNVATMKAAHLSLSTLTGSTLSLTTHITAPMAIYSTMMGSTITVSTMTGSTLFGSTMVMSSIRTSFLTLSTLTVSSINNNAPGTGSFSTFTVSSLISVSSISSASTIYTSSLITTASVGIGSTIPMQRLYVDSGSIGINSRNQIVGGAAVYFYNTPYMGTIAKTAIITEGIDHWTTSKLHLCTNGDPDLSTQASIANARLTVMPWGAVGINNTSPLATLDVTGSFRVLSSTYAALGSGTGIDIIYSGGGTLSCGTRGSGGVLTAATMGYAASAHTFYTGTNAGTNAMTINSSGQVGIGTTNPASQLGVHGGNANTAITVANGFNAGFYTQYGLAYSASQYSANSLAGDTVVDAIGGNLILESQNKNIYLSMPSTNTSNVLSIAGSGTRPTFSTAGWGSLTNTIQYSNIALSWTAPVTCNISSISMYLGQGNNGTNISLSVNGTFINEWWPFQGYGLYVINATGSSVANGVATTPTPFSALNQLIVQAGQVLTIYVSSLQTYNYFYYGRDSTTSGIGFSIVYNAPKVDLSLLNTTTTLSLGLSGVGIGTTAPSSKLTIHANPITTGIGTATFCGIHIQPDGGGVGDQFNGITWTGSASGNTQTHAGILVQGSGSYGTKMYFQTTDSWVAGTKNRMIIDNSGNVGIGLTNPTNRLDTFDGVARIGTHATGRALYATYQGGEYSDGIAEFRHTNGTQGIGIGFNGLYACGSNTNQDFNIIAKGTGSIYTRSPVRLTGPGDNCMTYYGPNSQWGAYLVVGAGTDKANENTAQVISTNGNLHMDAGNSLVMYYGYYPWSRSAQNSHQFYGHIYMANYLSIGTSTVRYPLYITTAASWSWTLAHYLAGGGTGVPYHNAYGTWEVSIWTERAIVTTMWFGTVSDQRIKKNIQPVGDMLEIINKIEIVSFDFIDEPNNKRDECGIIAQQLETVFPNAVDTSVGVIPCYLKFATSQHNVGDDVHILFEYDTTDPQQNFKVGDKIKIHAGQKTDTVDKDKGSHHVVVKSIINGGFVTTKWKDYHANDGVFLHGKEVNDFRNVDKEQLGILALKGVQELSSMVTVLNGTCASLQAADALLQAAEAATSSQMAALQQENAQLKSQMAALLSWARAQGYSS